MYATQFGYVDLVELLLELGHEEEVISVVSYFDAHRKEKVFIHFNRITKELQCS
jgi:hypothetical protein